MPPKKGSKITSQQKQKLVEDKTFGLKNKKGKKNQEYIKQVETSVTSRFSSNAAEKKALKRAEKEEKAMMDSLFKTVRPKLSALKPKKKKKEEAEVEPEKKDLYSDSRDKSNNESSADWDQEMLEKVVQQKHASQKVQTSTDKVCKFFLDAVEKGLYGWFWICPNGGDNCKYRHALPAGYVLKKDRKKKEEEEAQLTLEELIDKEREELSKRTNLTPINPETFAKWKKKKVEERRKALKASNKKKKKAAQAGKTGQLTGREFFSFRPELGDEDIGDDEGGTFDFPKKKIEFMETSIASQGEKQDVEFDASVFAAVDVNDMDDDDNNEDVEGDNNGKESTEKKAEEEKEEEDIDDEDEEPVLDSSDATTTTTTTSTTTTTAAENAVTVGDVSVDADLFADELGDLELDDM
eukprot:m.16237 g.16237  ORF g.16237 m.16237 type:complete len:409 (+) comp4587_c0_seq1:65-1291(+)